MYNVATMPRRTAFPTKVIRTVAEMLLHAVLLTIGILYIFPFIWTLGSSLKTPSEFFSQGVSPWPAGPPQWINFNRAWEGAQFSAYFVNTLFIAVMTSIFVILFTSMAAYTLAKLRLPGKRIIVSVLTILFLFPSGFSIVPLFQIIYRLGLLNTLWSVILALTGGGMMFNTILFYGYIQNIPRELEEAAIIDGAGIPQRYWFIVLPMCRPMIATVGLFTFLGAWNEFFLSLVFTLARPDLRTLAVGMYAFVGQNSRDWTLICAGATISLLPIILLFILMQRYFVNAFAGAVKA